MSAFKVMKGCRRGWGLFIDLLSKNTTAHPWKQKKSKVSVMKTLQSGFCRTLHSNMKQQLQNIVFYF